MMATQNTTAERPLRFGTLGWQRPAWLQTYYPEDLPTDWQLGYYANELASVLLPLSAWSSVTAETLSDWVEETHADFRFFLMADATLDSAHLDLATEVLGPRLGGVVWSGGGSPKGVLTKMPDLSDGIQGWSDTCGLRLAVLDVAGKTLRQQRGLLDVLAPSLSADRPCAVIVEADDVTPAGARELQTVAELMGLA